MGEFLKVNEFLISIMSLLKYCGNNSHLFKILTINKDLYLKIRR